MKMTRILMVQHDQPAVRLLAWGLAEEGVEVIVAPGDGAPARFDTRPPDVIVMNTHIDAAHKRTIIAALRMLAPDAGIIDLAPGAEAPGRDTGADAYLEEPYGVSQLVERIRTLVPEHDDPGDKTDEQRADILARARRAREAAAMIREQSLRAHARTDDSLARAQAIWDSIRESRDAK